MDLLTNVVSSVKLRGPMNTEEEIGLQFYLKDYDRLTGTTTYHSRPGYTKYIRDEQGMKGFKYSLA